MMSFDREVFESWLFDLENGELGDRELEELREQLRRSKEAQECFAKWQVMRFALQQEGSLMPDLKRSSSNVHIDSGETREIRPSSAADSGAERTPPASRSVSWFKLLAIAATLVIVMLGGRVLYLESIQMPTNAGLDPLTRREVSTPIDSSTRANSGFRQEKTSRGLALVTQLISPVFDGDSQFAATGSALSTGVFALTSGKAQIEFFAGATVVVEGPARLELISADKVRCLRGKLRAQVPPAARGFEILVEGNRIVDLGTEFGLEVDGSKMDLQVFDGEVEFHRDLGDKQPPAQLLTKGQAVSWSASDQSSHVIRNATPDGFLDLSDLTSEAEAQRVARFETWQKYSRELRRDPRLITYYAMDRQEQWRRKLPCDSGDPELDGAIVGSKVTAGRWPQKKALEFKHPGDRVKVRIPGEFRSLSFVCWVRIDSLDRWYNSLFLTDNYQRGEPHWQILDSGQLFFSVRVSQKPSGPEHREVVSPVFWKPSMSGQWLNLATTYDVDAKATSHYLNGELLVREGIPDAQLVEKTRIGLASIGNWSSPTRPDEVFAVRNLNGRMDEFMIFSEAISPEEVREIYTHGKP